jgi:hypothetical protein
MSIDSLIQSMVGTPQAQRPASKPAFDERAFQSWYGDWARKTGINPNPDDPLQKYDYRGAYSAGVVPQIDPGDGRYHWDSRFKADDHPNRFVNGEDTKTGRRVDPIRETIGRGRRR